MAVHPERDYVYALTRGKNADAVHLLSFAENTKTLTWENGYTVAPPNGKGFTPRDLEIIPNPYPAKLGQYLLRNKLFSNFELNCKTLIRVHCEMRRKTRFFVDQI